MSHSTPIAAATDPRLLLAVEQLGKRFCLHMLGAMALPVLHGFSFQVREGDFAVLSGPSGSGKSTVLKCIYRSYLATEGSIYFRCADDTWLDIVQCDEQQILSLRQHEIGYVSQFLRCAPRVAAEEVVASPRIAQTGSPAEAKEEARALLRRFRIPEKLWKAFPVSFSGGEQQRINLARAIIQKPRLLLLDEPTASLDHRAIEAFWEALEEVRQNGTTCLAIFHDRVLIDRFATRVVALNGHSNGNGDGPATGPPGVAGAIAKGVH
jgi:alpha-D-ribose 1-methylphosphonate 5-triphosphate synthase subunit PhnL